MKKLSIAYFGTPDFSAHFLERLIKNKLVDVKFIVTQEDKPVGRKQILTPSPVKKVAKKYKVPVDDLSFARAQSRFSPERLTKSKSSPLRNVDLTLVYAFGHIIPKDMLDLPKYGFWNVHPSLLPKYRGASPVAGPLMSGDRETGVSLMKMDAQMDHGPIIVQEKLEIRPKEMRPELTMRLTDLAYQMFKKQIVILSKAKNLSRMRDLKQVERSFGLHPQDDSRATYTKLLKKEDGFIPLKNFKFQISNSPEKLFNLFRGLYPWPGIWTLLRLKTSAGQAKEVRLKITDMDLVYPERSRRGKFILKKVQLEGKKEVDFETFNKAYKVF